MTLPVVENAKNIPLDCLEEISIVFQTGSRGEGLCFYEKIGLSWDNKSGKTNFLSLKFDFENIIHKVLLLAEVRQVVEQRMGKRGDEVVK